MGVKRDKNAIKKIIRELQQTRAKESLIIGRETAALIKVRVQNKGKKANGQAFGKYSTNQLPLYFFDDVLRPSAKAKLKKKGKNTASYEEVRRASNLPTDFINLTFSGEMWRSTQAQLISNDNTTSVILIAGITRRSKRLLDFNSRRYGDILAINEKERQMIIVAHRNRVLKVIRKYLNVKNI